MRRLYPLMLSSLLCCVVQAQELHIGVFGGTAVYMGDLTDTWVPKKLKPAVGVTASLQINDHISVRTGLTYAQVGADDRYSKKPVLVARNLSFQTNLVELSVVGEYSLFNLQNKRTTPYVFAGLALFHFNPYAYTDANEKVYLAKLSTEGQGLSAFASHKPYHLIQPAIPIGGGFKFRINDRWRLAAEIGLRKTFTDYLDDVSTTYVDRNTLLAAKGQTAVDMAYRTPEAAYPADGAIRGNPNKKDFYYFAGVHLTSQIGKMRGGKLNCWDGR